VHTTLTEVVLVIAVAVVVAFVLRRLSVPTVVSFVLAGALLGPGGVGLVRDRHQIEVLAEIGVVLLLFVVGLKLSVRDLWRQRAIAFVGGGLQVLGTGVLAAGVAMALGRPLAEAVVWGAVVTLSSTALVMTLLEGSGDLGSAHGRSMVSILLFQDLAVVPIILALPLLSGGGSPARVIGIASQSLAIVAITVLGARVVFPRLTALVVGTRSRELFTVARRLNRDATIVARTRYLREVEPLQSLGADQVVPEEFETSIELTGRVLAMYGASGRLIAREQEALRARHYGPLRSEDEGHGLRRLDDLRRELELESVTLEQDSPAVGESLRALALRGRTGATVLAIERGGRLLVNPDPLEPLAAGDRLLVVADGNALEALRSLLAAR
jgi:voltage-gated potassium channel Kch